MSVADISKHLLCDSQEVQDVIEEMHLLDDKDDFVEIFRGDQSWKTDMLEVALQEKDIPCYRQSGNVTGLIVSPGLYSPYAPESIIYVPREKIQEVKDILSELPFDSGKTISRERPLPTFKQWKFFTIYLLLLGLIAVLTVFLTYNH